MDDGAQEHAFRLCYLGAALAYLRFDGERRRRTYAIALALFVLALFSKTVTATLPAALLVVFWWQRGRIRLARGRGAARAFFALGVVGRRATAWVERTYVGAEGAEFQFSTSSSAC